jgi:hypothetical protein
MRRHQTPTARWPAQGPQVTRITARCWADDGGFFRVSGMRERWHVWQASGIASRSAPLALAAAENHRPGLSVSRNLPESHLGLEVLPKNSKRKKSATAQNFSRSNRGVLVGRSKSVTPPLPRSSRIRSSSVQRWESSPCGLAGLRNCQRAIMNPQLAEVR